MPQPTHYHGSELISPEVGITVRRGIRVPDPIESHEHDFTELVLVEGGHAEHRIIGSGRQRRHRVGAGDLVVVAPGERHAYGKPDGLVVTNLLFTPVAIADRLAELAAQPAILELLVLEPSLRGGDPRPHRHLDLATRRAVSACLQVMERETASRASGWQMVVRSRLIELLALASRSVAADDSPGSDSLIRAAGFMEERLGDRLSLSQIAAEAGLCPQHFCSRFHAETGETPMEFLRHARVAKAQLLLADSDARITAIALETGFSDASHLARVFRSVTGFTPAAWRRRAQRSGDRADA